MVNDLLKKDTEKWRQMVRIVKDTVGEEMWEIISQKNNDGPKVDLYDGDHEIIICIEVPGLKDNDSIDIRVHQNMVIIKGMLNGRYNKDTQYRKVYGECNHGVFVRKIQLPAPVEDEAIKKVYNNGILEIIMAKRVPLPI